MENVTLEKVFRVNEIREVYSQKISAAVPQSCALASLISF